MAARRTGWRVVKRAVLDVAAVTVGATAGLIGAATVLLWATARLAHWSGRRDQRRHLGGRTLGGAR